MNAQLVPMATWKDYADTIWTEFTKRSGKPERLMSAAEWEVLREWLYGGVPLRVALRGIQDSASAGKTLTYYRGPVRAAFEHWRKAVA